MTLKDKQNFIDACNNIDGIDFISIALWYLQKIETKDELNDFVGIFGGIFKVKSIDASETLTELCILLRDRVYDILIANGDVPENNYIHLYNYFSLCILQEDSRYTAYEQFVDQNLYSDGISDMERVFLLVLRFFSSFVNSRNDAFVKFFTDVTKLNIVDVGSIDFSGTVIDFLNASSVQIEDVLPIVTELLEKEQYFARSKVDRRSLFNWLLHGLWLVQKYFNHPSWTSLYPKWKAIFYEHIARDECDEAMYVHFFIYHFMGNSFQTQAEWKSFNDEIDRPAAKYYQEWCGRANLPKCKAEQSSGRKIIGILQDRFVENSPFKVLYSVLKDVTASSEFREQYEVRVYLMSYFEKSENDQKCIDMMEKLGISVWDGAGPFYRDGIYHSHLNKALYIRQKIIDDGVDVMIHGACYDINDFLVTNRMAPKQIYWIHGNFEFDIPSIDKRISHIGDKSHMKQSDYEVEHFDFETEERYTNPEEEKNKALAEKVRAKFPKDAVLLGSIGRLVKMDNYEYLGAVAEIMKQCPNAIYLACGGGNIDSVKEKAIEVGIPIDRWYFEGHIDPHVYGYVIDVYLNTFPEMSGQAAVEFLEKNKYKFTVSKRQLPEEPLFSSDDRYVNDAIEWVDIIQNIGKSTYLDRYDVLLLSDGVKKEVSLKKDLEPVFEVKAKIIKNKFPEDAVIIGSISSPIKIDSDAYLKVVSIIMRECPKTIYLACGIGIEDSIKEKLKEYDIDEQRFIFEGFVDAHVYAYVIDVYLDTFLANSGYASVESAEKKRKNILLPLSVLYGGDDDSYYKKDSIFQINMEDNYIKADKYILDAIDHIKCLSADCNDVILSQDLENILNHFQAIVYRFRSGYAYTDYYISFVNSLLADDPNIVFVAIVPSGAEYLSEKIQQLSEKDRFLISGIEGLDVIKKQQYSFYLDGLFGGIDFYGLQKIESNSFYLNLGEKIINRFNISYLERFNALFREFVSKKELPIDRFIGACFKLPINADDTLARLHFIKNEYTLGNMSPYQAIEGIILAYDINYMWKKVWSSLALDVSDIDTIIYNFYNIPANEAIAKHCRIMIKNKEAALNYTQLHKVYVDNTKTKNKLLKFMEVINSYSDNL